MQVVVIIVLCILGLFLAIYAIFCALGLVVLLSAITLATLPIVAVSFSIPLLIRYTARAWVRHKLARDTAARAGVSFSFQGTTIRWEIDAGAFAMVEGGESPIVLAIVLGVAWQFVAGSWLMAHPVWIDGPWEWPWGGPIGVALVILFACVISLAILVGSCRLFLHPRQSREWFRSLLDNTIDQANLDDASLQAALALQRRAAEAATLVGLRYPVDVQEELGILLSSNVGTLARRPKLVGEHMATMNRNLETDLFVLQSLATGRSEVTVE